MSTVRTTFLPRSIRERWAVKVGLAILAVLLVIGSIGGILFVQTNAQLTQDTEYRMETAAETQAASMSQWVEQTQREAHTLAYAHPIQTGDPERISAFLRQERKAGNLPEEVTAVHYLDTTTAVYRGSSAEEAVGVSAGDRGAPWAQRSLDLGTDSVMVTEPYSLSESQQPVMAVIADVPNQDNRALVLIVDLQARAAEMQRPVRKSFTKVVDSTGTTVLSHRTDQILTQNMGESDVEGVDSMAVKKGLNGQSGYMEMTMGGNQMTMGYAPVKGTDWVLMTHSPKRTMFALQHQISRNILLLLGAALLGFGLIGVTIGRNTTKALNHLTGKAEQLEAGDLDVELQSRRVDEIGQLYAAFGNMRDSLQETIEDAKDARKQAEQAREESEALVDHLETKADAYSTEMDQAAAGDLTIRLDPGSESPAMTQIAEAFNEMVADLEATLAEIQQFAADVASNSEEVSASAGEIETASQQVSESVQEISAGTDEEYEQLQETSNEMQTLSGTIEEVASSANQVAAVSDQAAEHADQGAEKASQALEEMNAIESETDETVAEVESLAEEIDQISEIVELITDITEQTNQLALNASIEAARAGEAGEGFAVVADEVKELAQEAGEATTEVEELINEIRASTETAVEDIQSMGNSVSTGLETVEDALDALDEMADDIEEVNQGVQEIDAVTDQQASSTEEAVAMIEEIETISEETSNEAESVSAAAEEQASSLSEVTQSVDDLNERAMELQNLLSEFELNVGSGEGEKQSAVEPGASKQVSAAPDGGRPPED